MVVAVVVPFLDEGAHLGALLASLAAQDRPPEHLLLVDDGSRDGSLELARAFAAEHGWARALSRRPPRAPAADRLAEASELAAFLWGVERLPAGWDVVAKLDADLALPPGALRELLARLDEDPRLGIAGALLSEAPPGGGPPRRVRIGDGHVHGATKLYRRACFEAIAPIPAILGWDTIDELRARRAGWRTASFALAGGDPVHLRPRGSHDGLVRAAGRFGACAYAFGEPAPVAALEALRMAPRRPRVVGGAAYAAGWAGAALRGAPRAEPELRAWVRRGRYRRLAERAADRLRSAPPAARPARRAGRRVAAEARHAAWRARNRRFAPRLRHDPAAPALLLSPHPDDAAIDCWSLLDSPAALTVATVFAGDPPAPEPGPWDRLAGARDAIALARERRAEDREALAAAGREPLHLPFVDASHRGTAPPPSFAALDAALAARVGAASQLLAPAVLGVAHPDHVAVRDFALALHAAAGIPLRLYADAPYATAYGWPPWVTGEPPDGRLDVDAYWAAAGTPAALVARERARIVRLPSDAAARKLAALRRYRSQFAVLDRGPLRQLSDPRIHAVEVLWPVP